MSKEPKIKCSRCKHPIVCRKFKYLQKEQLVFHPKCYIYYKLDKKNKDFYARRKNAIDNPLQGGTGSKK